MIKYIFAIALVALPDIVYSQPAVQFVKTFGDSASESFLDLFATSDSSYVMVGRKKSIPGDEGSQDFYLVKSNADGETEWEITFGGDNSSDGGTTIIESDDGDYIIGGFSNYNAAIARVSPDGDVRWIETYEAGAIEAIIELKEGDFVAVGKDASGRYDLGLILRINPDGEVVWRNEPEFLNGQNILMAMRETEGGVIVTGFANRNVPMVYHQNVAQKVALNGDVIWTQVLNLEGNTEEFGLSMCSTVGGFVITGRSILRNAERLFTRKINGNGESVWYENSDLGFGSSMSWNGSTRLSNDDIAMVGQAGQEGGDYRPIVKVITGDNQLRWSSIYDMRDYGDFRADYNQLTSVVESFDGGLIACGRVMNADNGHGFDGMIMKLEPIRLAPLILIHLPFDTLLNVLTNDSVDFLVVGNDQRGLDLEYLWIYDNIDTLSRDTSAHKLFDELGEKLLSCTVSNDEFSSTVRWHVTVTDLYISAFTPNTLDLTLRRGSSVDFSIDTVRYVEGEPPEYLWTMTNLDNAGEQEIGGSETAATITFNQSGSYSVEGLAYRDESSDAVTWNVTVRGAIWAFAPEALAFEVLPDSLVQFDVLPTVPDAEGQTIRWLVDGEMVAEDTTGFTWRADFNPPYLAIVQVVVADTVESDTVSWEVTVREPDAVDDKRDAYPTRMELLSVSPNPFNSMLSIRYDVGARHAVPLQIAIYDISGRMVAEIASPTDVFARNEETKQSVGGFAKTSSVVWDASSIPAGVYFVRLQSGHEIVTKKVVLLK